MGKSLVNKNIVKITPYIPGKPIEEVEREFKIRKIIKLASNENPLGTSPLVLKAIKDNLSNIHRYPDASGFYLKNKIAKVLKLKPYNIVLGNGSDELIDVIIKTFVGQNENIITSEVTFLEYEIIARINNRRIIKVPLSNFKYDLPRIRKKVNPQTKLIFIANPNNPTGTYVNKDELDDFLNDLPKKVIVVLDEAYDLFVDVKDFPCGLDYLESKNVIILKTFSKAYGLAGLRLGYAVAQKEFTSYMEKARQPFNVNYLAQIAGISALEDKEFLKRTRETVLEGKYYLYEALDKLKLSYIPSVANFITIDLKRDALRISKEMLKYGIIVRDLKQYGLNNFIRVTVGKKKENQRFIQILKKVLQGVR